ncbi:MAG TPA: hypothetical protein VM324_06705 [Egibacteraceae bacterium]|jgi:hypothetical protein|nr:hypothetical protein [Egibacteraceae bacterium]
MTPGAHQAPLDAFATYLDRLETALAAEDWDAVEGAGCDVAALDPQRCTGACGCAAAAEALLARAIACERRIRAAMDGRAAELGGIAARRRAAAVYAPGESSDSP